MRIVKIYQPCEVCEGTGLEHIEGHSVECWKCQGYGEYILNIKKEDDYIKEILEQKESAHG